MRFPPGACSCVSSTSSPFPQATVITKRPDKGAVQRFAARLGALGLNATVRRELGSDIAAACGQLRRAEAGKAGDGTK